MSGTRPLVELLGQVVVRLTDGLSKTPRLKFPRGSSSDPISVGLRGSWAILGEGMLDVHLYLGFDGQQLLVAPAAPEAAVLVNGHPLQGRGWSPVALPGVLRFGGVELKAEQEGAPLDVKLAAVSQLETAFDGGRLRDRAQQLAQREPMVPVPAPVAALGPTMLSAPVPQKPGPEKPVPEKPAAEKPGQPRFKPANVRDSALERHELGKKIYLAGGGSAPPTELNADPPVVPLNRSFWSGASLPKKLSLALLPFALLGALFSGLGEEEAGIEPAMAASASGRAGGVPAPSSGAQATASAVAAPASAPAIAPEPAPSAEPELPAAGPSSAPPSPTEEARAEPAEARPAGRGAAPPGAPSGRAPNAPEARAALDAAFLGNLAESSRRYQQLSEQDPSNEAYRRAARLTAESAVRKP